MAPKNKKVKMTQKQKLFCQHYLSNDHNGADAVRKSGSKCRPHVANRIAAENLTKPVIKEYLSTRMEKAIENAGVGLHWRLEMLRKAAEACMNGAASKEGVVVPDSLIKAMAEINKMEGTYAPVQTESKVTVTDDNSHVDALIEKHKKDV